MIRPLTNQICTMAELRKPQKVFDHAGGKPVAILKNSALVGYLVPAEAVSEGAACPATVGEAMEAFNRRRAVNQPILDYLRNR